MLVNVKTKYHTFECRLKRSSGYFSIGDIHGKSIHNSVKVKNSIQRISARKILLTVMENCGSFKKMPNPVSSERGFPEKIWMNTSFENGSFHCNESLASS